MESLVPDWHIFARAPIILMVERTDVNWSRLVGLWIRNGAFGRRHSGTPWNG